MSDLHVACAVDERYVAHSAVMLHSLVTHAGGPVVTHYLHGPDLSPHQAAALELMMRRYGADLMLHEITPDRVAQFPSPGRFGPAMWYRALLPEMLPAVERLLYLDVDVIVMDEITPLWTLDLQGAYLAAVTNVSVDAYRDHPQELGLERDEYFNSGVLMLNLDLMRDTGFSAKLLEGLRDHPHLPFPDQDALNLAARSQKLKLHPRWNCMNSFTTYRPVATEILGETSIQEALDRPAIRHFEGPADNKPWHLLHNRAEQHLYHLHRVQTPWPEYRFDGRTVRNRIKRTLMDVRSVRQGTPQG